MLQARVGCIRSLHAAAMSFLVLHCGQTLFLDPVYQQCDDWQFEVSSRQSNALVCMERTDFWYLIMERRSDNDTSTNFAIVLASEGFT